MTQRGLDVIRVSLLKLISDFECLEVEELYTLSRVLSDRYDLRDLDRDTLTSILELLIAEGLVEVKMGCYRLTEKGVNVVRSAFKP